MTEALSRNELIEKYRPYVRSIVSKVMKTISRDVDFDDLVGYGELGLIEAADRFDPKYNVNFMTFAYYRIRGAVYDGLRGMGWVSRSQYAKIRYEQGANHYINSVNERNESTYGSRSVNDEVNQISEVITGLASIFITSLDASEAIQVESEDPESNPYHQTEFKEARRVLQEALEKLPEQEKLLLQYYYYEDVTLEEAGTRLGLSKSWASRLHSRAIQKLHKLVSELNPHADEAAAPPAAEPKRKRGRPKIRPTIPRG
jgi:RNA polymerase sigma factor for flagellar operon FliA